MILLVDRGVNNLPNVITRRREPTNSRRSTDSAITLYVRNYLLWKLYSKYM